LKKITEFFFNLTRRNWGAPYHFIIACFITLLFIRLFGLKTVDHPLFPLFTVFLLILALGYEIWQFSRKQNNWRNALEDMLFAAAGYATGLIPILFTSHPKMINLGLAALLVPKRSRPRVCIDAGHGGKDGGAIYGGLREADLNIRAALLLDKALKKYKIDTVLTREDNSETSLGRRIGRANSSQADFLVSLHTNASPSEVPYGVQSYYYSEAGEKVATRLQPILEKVYGKQSPWNKSYKANFYISRHTIMPSALIEMAFMSNPEDLELLKGDYIDRLMKELAKGIKEIFINGD
jgi:N-acetylmuramoyl-L-alanine amidase